MGLMDVGSTARGTLLNGTIPSSIGRLTALRTLYDEPLRDAPFMVFLMQWLLVCVCVCLSRHTRDLSSTKLRGTIPTELGQLSALTRLDLNALGLQGTFPSFVTCRLTSLYVHSMTRYDQSLSLIHPQSSLTHARSFSLDSPMLPNWRSTNQETWKTTLSHRYRRSRTVNH